MNWNGFINGIKQLVYTRSRKTTNEKNFALVNKNLIERKKNKLIIGRRPEEKGTTVRSLLNSKRKACVVKQKQSLFMSYC